MLKDRTYFLFFVLLFVLSFCTNSLRAEEPWFGTPPEYRFNVGLSVGTGEFNGTYGPAVLVTGATRLIEQGFAPRSINNQVFLELQLGPLFVNGETALLAGAHLRWDFILDINWTFFAVGGMGTLVGGSGLGSPFHIYPRFGIGAMASLLPELVARAEISHEYQILGLMFKF